ncbi:MAG: c-type cytochrome [Acidobacteria bacterium]|nr:c-type cytochrome [Acidobacteriota bacterium]
MKRGDLKSEITNLRFCLSPSVRRPSARACVVAAWLAVVVALAACEREKRETVEAAPGARTEAISLSDLRPGGGSQPGETKNPDEGRAYDISQGKQFFSYYNCAGCHFNGGGGIGPPLMDDKWIYGSDPANIYETIVEGRPNGMPSFRGKITDAQVWQLVGYVRSMSGQLPKDVSPTRSDHMNARKSEQTTEKEQPKKTTLPETK